MDAYGAQTGAPGAPGLSLQDLLQQSRKLTNQLGRDSDLPSIQLGFDQIESQSRKLVSKSMHTANPAADARAYVPSGVLRVTLTGAGTTCWRAAGSTRRSWPTRSKTPTLPTRLSRCSPSTTRTWKGSSATSTSR